LDPLKCDPGLVAVAVETVVLNQLAQERDDSLKRNANKKLNSEAVFLVMFGPSMSCERPRQVYA
jgi:hypothetical protein